MSENKSFGNAHEHIAFARLQDIVQKTDENNDDTVIKQKINSDNVTTILLFIVLCVVVNLFMSFCRCLCTRWFRLHLRSTKDEMMTQKDQVLLNELPKSGRSETVSMIDNPIYSPSAPRADYRKFSNTPLQLGVLNHYCAFPKIDIEDDSIPDIQCDGRRYVMYPATSYEILI